jgi:hypothetical protein
LRNDEKNRKNISIFSREWYHIPVLHFLADLGWEEADDECSQQAAAEGKDDDHRQMLPFQLPEDWGVEELEWVGGDGGGGTAES